MLPLSLKLALRFTFTRFKNGYIHFIAWFSMLGIALGVAAILIVLAIMDGFQHEITQQLIKEIPHLTIYPERYDPNLANNIKQALPPYAIKESYNLLQKNVFIIANDKFTPLYVNALPDNILQEKLKLLHAQHSSPNGFNISQSLAQKLAVTAGSQITIALEKVNEQQRVALSTLSVPVSGIFKDDNQITTNIALTSIDYAEQLFNQEINAYAVNLNNPMLAPYLHEELHLQFRSQLQIKDWQQYFSGIFFTLASTKQLLTIMLAVIIVVAIFNLLATLVMIVNDKFANIAIMRTLGAHNNLIFRVFMLQALILSAMGTISGVIIGFVVSANITSIANFLQKLLGYQFVNQSMYVIDFLPAHFSWSAALALAVTTLLLSMLAAVYPAIYAARQEPLQLL